MRFLLLSFLWTALAQTQCPPGTYYTGTLADGTPDCRPCEPGVRNCFGEYPSPTPTVEPRECESYTCDPPKWLVRNNMCYWGVKEPAHPICDVDSLYSDELQLCMTGYPTDSTDCKEGYTIEQYEGSLYCVKKYDPLYYECPPNYYLYINTSATCYLAEHAICNNSTQSALPCMKWVCNGGIQPTQTSAFTDPICIYSKYDAVANSDGYLTCPHGGTLWEKFCYTFEHAQAVPCNSTETTISASFTPQVDVPSSSSTPRILPSSYASPSPLKVDNESASASQTPKEIQRESATQTPKEIQRESASATQTPKEFQRESTTQTPKEFQRESATQTPKEFQRESASQTPKEFQRESATQTPKVDQRESASASQTPKEFQRESASQTPKVDQRESASATQTPKVRPSATSTPTLRLRPTPKPCEDPKNPICIKPDSLLSLISDIRMSPLPSRRPSATPLASIITEAFPSPWIVSDKFLLELTNIPAYIPSKLSLLTDDTTKFEKPETIQKIQSSLACSLRVPLDKIRIESIYEVSLLTGERVKLSIDPRSWMIGNSDSNSCIHFGNQTNVLSRRLQRSESQIEIDYLIVEPTREILALNSTEFAKIISTSSSMISLASSVGSSSIESTVNTFNYAVAPSQQPEVQESKTFFDNKVAFGAAVGGGIAGFGVLMFISHKIMKSKRRRPTRVPLQYNNPITQIQNPTRSMV